MDGRVGWWVGMNTCALIGTYFTQSGDRDFSGDIRSLRDEGFPTMLFTGMCARTHGRTHGSTHAHTTCCMHACTCTGGSLVSKDVALNPHFMSNRWDALVKECGGTFIDKKDKDPPPAKKDPTNRGRSPAHVRGNQSPARPPRGQSPGRFI